MMGIILGAVVAFAFGAVWYTVLFGKIWSRLMGITEAEMENSGGMKGMAKPLIINFLATLLTAIVVKSLFPALMSQTLYDFLRVLIVIWFGFSFPIYVSQVIWEKKSWKLLLINSASGIISIVLIGSIIFYFP